MWVKPGYQPDRPTPPQETGRRLACFDRPRGEQLRVTAEEYNGHGFIRCQVWAAGSDGQAWPLKGKCVTFKLRELGALVEALAAVAGDAGQGGEPRPEPPRDNAPKFIDRGRPVRPPWDASALRRAGRTGDGGGEFNEF